MFERLKGQHDGADFAGLLAPDEFDLAFVRKEDEAKCFREGLTGLDKGDEVALLGVGEVVTLRVVVSWHGCCYLIRYPIKGSLPNWLFSPLGGVAATQTLDRFST